MLLERDERLNVIATASNADDGIEKALAAQADVVVMDIGLPGIDGLEATRRLREARPTTKVIILSGSDGTEHEDAARAAGAACYLTKGRLHDEVVSAIVSAADQDANDLSGRDGLAG